MSIRPQACVVLVVALVAVPNMAVLQGCLFRGGGEEVTPEEVPMDEATPEESQQSERTAAAAEEAKNLVAEGMEAKRLGDLDTAQQKFEGAVAGDPNNADAHWALAWVYAEKNMKDKAIAQFNLVKNGASDQDKIAEADKAIGRLREPDGAAKDSDADNTGGRKGSGKYAGTWSGATTGLYHVRQLTISDDTFPCKGEVETQVGDGQIIAMRVDWRRLNGSLYATAAGSASKRVAIHVESVNGKLSGQVISLITVNGQKRLNFSGFTRKK